MIVQFENRFTIFVPIEYIKLTNKIERKTVYISYFIFNAYEKALICYVCVYFTENVDRSRIASIEKMP